MKIEFKNPGETPTVTIHSVSAGRAFSNSRHKYVRLNTNWVLRDDGELFRVSEFGNAAEYTLLPQGIVVTITT